MIPQNKAEFDKTNISYWRNKGFTGKGTVWAILDDSGKPYPRDNIINPLQHLEKYDKNIGHKTQTTTILRQLLPEATIYAMRFNSEYSDECIDWIIENKNMIDGINVSMSANSESLKRLMRLKDINIPVFFAVGNSGRNKSNFVSLPFGFGIGAWLERYDRLDLDSNYDKGLDFVSYTNIYYWNSNKSTIVLFNGTSCATVMAIGILGHYAELFKRAYNRSMTEQEAFEFLLKNVDDKLTPGRDSKSGYGLIKLPSYIPDLRKPEKEVIKLKNNLELAQFAKNALSEKWGYCLGCFGQVLTTSLLHQKTAQGGGVGLYNSRHRVYLQGFMGKRVSDCYGLVKAFLWWNAGNPKYIASQDRNQEGAFNAAKEKGPLSNMPEIPGLILWMKGHAGIYVGNGEFIECVGVPVGMRKGKIVNGRVTSGSPFTHWFKDTYIEYKPVAKPIPQTGKLKLSVNGKIKYINGHIENGISYADISGVKIALRELGEGIGFKVGWDPHNKIIIWND